MEKAIFWGIEFYKDKKTSKWLPENPESLERIIHFWINGTDRERDHEQWQDCLHRMEAEA